MTEHHHPELSTAALGRSGLSVSRLALGTMTFGVETDEAQAMEQLDRFREAGGTHVDTADVYGGGESERIIGRWLADRRPDEIVVATKGRFAPPPGSAGASRRSLVRSVDASLDRLGADAIDLYYVHGWDRDTPIEETLDTLSALVRAGKIHHLGWSNVTGWQLATLVTTARCEGFVEPCVVQPQYNLLDRGIELELLPACLDAGLAVAPWSPLGGGWLTGKYSRDQRPTGATRLGEDPDRGVEAYDVRNVERTWAVLDVLEDIAARHGRPMGQIAIAWLLARPGVATVLLGTRTVAQLQDHLAATDVALADDDLRRLTDVSAVGLPPYPYGMIEEFCDVDVWRRLGTTRS
jgi:aryl-alcohol dehydrogenase-like predicted oxidoreductase